MKTFHLKLSDINPELARQVREAQADLTLADYLEDIAIVEPNYQWLSTGEARALAGWQYGEDQPAD